MARTLSLDSLSDGSAGSAFSLLMLALRLVAGAMAPLLVGVVIVAVIVNIMQVGFFFSFKRVQPRAAALNPLKGFGKIFSGRDNLVHLAMNLLKLVLIAAVAYSAIHGKMAQILSVQGLEFVQIFSLGSDIVYSIALRIGAVLLVLAILDYAWQRWRNEQQLKMSKQEIKDEMRRMEGDPQIKSRRRQIAVQRLVQGIRKNVPTADVVVTNPTHYAVALKYDSETMNAQTIREIAIANGVPILERAPLARALYRLCEVGQEIPEQFYSAVAEILAYVYEVSGKLRQTA
jgi:flagellar biosynthetic protein FlhB